MNRAGTNDRLEHFPIQMSNLRPSSASSGNASFSYLAEAATIRWVDRSGDSFLDFSHDAYLFRDEAMASLGNHLL
jgi:hypothetical protein